MKGNVRIAGLAALLSAGILFIAPQDAARAGVFVHGMSGDLASEKLGEYGLTASDIADFVPFALKELTD